jgi:hypothetical protein
MNKDELAEIIYPDIIFDTTLPQLWVNDVIEGVGKISLPFPEPVPHFVWGYPPGYVFGIPLPLTTKALTWLETVAPRVAEVAVKLAKAPLAE